MCAEWQASRSTSVAVRRPLCSLILLCGCYAEIEGLPPSDPPAELPRRTFYETCNGVGDRIYGIGAQADLTAIAIDTMLLGPSTSLLTGLRQVAAIEGPVDVEGPAERLYRWSGDASDAPVAVVDVAAPLGAVAKTVIAYPQSNAIQIVFDMSDTMVIDAAPCRQVATPDRSFQDVVVQVD
jgi:hypothetical protein